MTVKHFCGNAEPFKVVQNVRLDTFKLRFCRFQILRFDGKREILCFDESVVSFGKLISKHIRIFRADFVEFVPLRRYADMFIRILSVSGAVDERKLETDGAVEVIQKIAPSVKYCGFVFVCIKHIVYVVKAYGFRIAVVPCAADSVWEHSLKRNGVLRGHLSLIGIFMFCDNGFNLFSFASCELSR